MRSIHGEGGKEVLCSFCGKGFATLRLARQHEMLSHDTTGMRRYSCTECKITFADKGEKHLLFTWSLPGSLISGGERLHHVLLLIGGLSLGKLKRHLRGVHSTNMSYVCDLCGKAFRWEMTLKRHIKTHGEKNIKCDFCEKRFFHKKTYLNHRMTHTGERP